MNGDHQLDYFEVPQGFLALPLVDNIDKEPNQNYELKTQGKIHGRKFQLVLDWLKTSDTTNWQEVVKEIFESDIILEDLLSLKFPQFLDYLIHIAYANPTINWNSISILEKYFENKFDHVHRWDLPSLDFEQDLKGYLTKRYKYSFSNEIKESLKIIKNLVDENIDLSEAVFPRIEWLKIQNDDFTNLSQMMELIGNLRVIQTTGQVKYEDYDQLMTEIYGICEKETLLLLKGNPEGKILFSVFYISIFIRDNPKVIESCKNLLSVATVELLQLSKTKRESYQWLTDAARVLITNELLKYKMEMVTEDILLRSISDRFLFPENTDLQKWMLTIETTDLPIQIAMILVRGYMGVEEILHRYSTQLPQSDNSITVTINNFLVSLITTFEMKYVHNDKKLNYFMEFWFVNSLVTTTFTTILITPPPQYTENTGMPHKVENSRFHTYFRFHLVCFQMLNQKYPFKEQIESVFSEENVNLELIGNEVFAKYFVDVFAQIFNFAQQSQINGMNPPLGIYRYMIYFLIQWMINLVDHIEYIVEDILMLFISFLRVATNMVQFYYNEKGRIKTGELWELNYILLELNLFVKYKYPPIYNIRKKVNREHIFDDFMRFIGEFEISQTISLVDTKYFAMDSVFDVASLNFELNETSLRPEKLRDENILEYMDLRNQLDDFLNELESKNTEQLKDVFANPQFKARDPPLTVLDHIKPERIIPGLYYPFIQPLRAYSAAIRFFDLVVELPEFREDTPEA